ncbi:MAG: GTPase HflX [Zoogloeaceae bacterium]|nr:GTPase HflX [Zoogloeaceae bacterium]
MFERPRSGERAVLVQLDLDQGMLDDRLAELKLLVLSAGASVEAVVTGRRSRPDPALFAGSGKVQEIELALRAAKGDLVVFNHVLSPAQQRNLERALECRVIDRTALILDIFAQRARSHEGKLQVELAQLQHLSTRLVRGWTHLERQKGGIGLRGPGEKQLETDRRLLGVRVKALKERLARIEKQRKVRRRGRERGDVLTVSLVGYTNAGKSTLFNALTKAGTYAADQLFATLDTTSRRLYVGPVGDVVLSDTVGFIRDLPHALVAAFHSTLEETASADLLLHVVDSASPEREAQIDAVNEVLREIGAGDVPQIMVFNKIDLTGAPAAVNRDECGNITGVFLSAASSEGLPLLRDALAEVAQRVSTANFRNELPDMTV